MDKFAMRTIIVEILAASGWTPCNPAAVAVKCFETTVGIKEAHAYVSRGDGYNYTLSGDYQSEGRNALESSCVLIPVGADADTVRRLTQQFTKQADAVVAQTYAARLLKSSSESA